MIEGTGEVAQSSIKAPPAIEKTPLKAPAEYTPTNAELDTAFASIMNIGSVVEEGTGDLHPTEAQLAEVKTEINQTAAEAAKVLARYYGVAPPIWNRSS